MPHKLLDRAIFSAYALDYLTFGNAYVERRDLMTRRAVGLKHALAEYVRRGADLESYFFVRGCKDEHEFKAGSVSTCARPTSTGMCTACPSTSACCSRPGSTRAPRCSAGCYYNNGSHAGLVLYISDPAQQEEDIDAIRTALKESKGPGNFRNLFLYSPNGKKDGVQLIPVSEVAARDDFFNIKNVSRDNVLAAHRISPQLLGIVPSNMGALAPCCRRPRCLRAMRSNRCRSGFGRSTTGWGRRWCGLWRMRCRARRVMVSGEGALEGIPSIKRLNA